MFSISFISNNTPKVPSGYFLGEIIIGNFRETFHASSAFWTKQQYELQWADAKKRILLGEITSAFITSMVNPKTANFIKWWPVYIENGKAIFQEQILFIDSQKIQFNEMNPYQSIEKRRSITDEGENISEWNIKISEIDSP